MIASRRRCITNTVDEEIVDIIISSLAYNMLKAGLDAVVYRGKVEAAPTPGDAADTVDALEQPAVWGFNLSIAPLHVERRHWELQQESRLVALDRAAEVCTALLWLAATFRMPPDQRGYGHIALALSIAQLAAIHWAPQFWSMYRPALLTASQLIRMWLLLPLPTMAQQGSNSSVWTTIVSRVWSHVFFVLFHQMPILYHIPWMVLSTGMGFFQCMQKLSLSPHLREADAPLLKIGTTLEQALIIVASSFCPYPSDPILVVGMVHQSAAVLASVLFTHVYGAVLLPLSITYVMEWRSKLRFLMTLFDSPSDRLAVYSPAAAVMEGSAFLAYMVCTLWLLLIGLSAWAACSAFATIYYSGGFQMLS